MSSTDSTSTQLADFDKQWNYGDPAASEKVFRELLASTVAKSNEEYRLQLKTQVARAQGLQRKFDEAHATLDEIESKVNDAFIAARVRYLLERGRVFNSSGAKDKAKPLFTEAWELASVKTGNAQCQDSASSWGGPGLSFHAVDAAHMLGIVESPDVALAWNERAIALAEKTDDARTRGWLGALYNNTGWTYHDRKEYKRALELFVNALHWHADNAKQQGKEESRSPPLLIARWTVARCYRSLGRTDQAMTIQRALEGDYQENGGEDGYVYEEIAELLLEMGKNDEAAPYFHRAYNVLSKDDWLVANETDRIGRLKKLGRVD